ncbi:GNAT family N-acetyltransferase [Dolichospermum sp. LEGE 00240]|jgi:GNAT superfamily N-acetyltransferase|uniref:GNAT family N-acetyltransferase n=1 Tax=Dolichospermum sp. LEGE 00240 TaxID=1828603 RepID=UPI0018819944|nr:GNAT family N-acetyltransferase [Dolichospermum sp. LEGE 00240]MBE9250044.1 GNAT family N-acetyltransferase [Dolichospermum sp. LEGE 00240]MBO1050952.1 GNAT family N-acetyltransferase [Dolichospermum sp. DET73]
MSDIKSGSIELRDYPPLESDKEYKFEVLSSGQGIATAHVKCMRDRQGKFWHLDNLFVHNQNRNQGYGTRLVNHLRDYLWSIDRLRIRVHPAIGLQVMEELAEKSKHNTETYTKEELDDMSKSLYLEMQQPDFWEKQAERNEVRDSKKLIEWYRKRGFIHDDPNGKHLWCYPERNVIVLP